tara:strand:+ start:922 stop:1566 length:645 start_codon:yes stop_codon:yes gene_type:complete
LATRTGINTHLINRLGANEQEIFVALKAEFDTETIYLWNGTEDLAIGGDTYIGAGSLLSIGAAEESSDLSSQGMTITVSGMNKAVLDLALTENYQNRFLTVFLGYLMGGSNEVAGTFTLFKGRMTAMTVNDTPQGATIGIDAENRLVDLERPSNFRYTKESQNFLHSGDTFFNRVASLQDKEIIWGRSSSSGGGGGGGGNSSSSGGHNRRIAHR